MDAVALHETASKWLDTFLQRHGDLADGDFNDGSGSFSMGNLFHGTALIGCPGNVGDRELPGYPDNATYELVHNGGTGRILYDLAEHYSSPVTPSGSKRTSGGCRRQPSGSFVKETPT